MYISKIYFFLIIMMSQSLGDVIFNDNFENPEKWTFISDQVMGGVSSGKVKFIKINKTYHAHITGNVSTKNKSLQGENINVSVKFFQVKKPPKNCLQQCFGNVSSMFPRPLQQRGR